MRQLLTNNDDEIRKYHRQRLLELSLKSLGEIPKLEDPNEEQQQWIEIKMRTKQNGF